MARRFEETVNIQQQALGTGAAQGLMSLADRLEGFKQSAIRIGQEQAVQRGVESAAQTTLETEMVDGREVTKAPKQKEERFIGGIEIKAHNKALRSAYLASLNNDNREAIANIEQENPSDVIKFNEAIEGYRKGVLKGVDPSSRQLVEQDLDSKITTSRLRVQSRGIQEQKAQANAERFANIESASNAAFTHARNGDKLDAANAITDAFATIDSMVESGDLSQDKAVRQKREIERETTEQGFRREFDDIADDRGFEAAFDELEERSKKVPSGWTPDEWDSYIAKQQKDLNRKRTRVAQDAKQSKEEAKLSLSVERGLLFTDPAIPADPAKSSQDRKDVNNYYNSVSPEWAALPIGEQVEKNLDFIKNTGLVPEQVISNVNASMRSGTPEQVSLMSDLMSRVQEIAPSSLKDIPEESRAISLQVSDAVKAGIDPVVALEQARKATFGLTDAERKTIGAQSQVAAKGLNASLQSFADSDVSEGGFDTGVFSRVPDVPAAMQGEYRSSFDRFMQMTGGNIEQAQKLAYQSTKSTWAVSETGGNKRFMKYAPEVIYSIPGVENDWIENQFNEEMESAGHLGAIIAVDHSVAREDQPSYPVIITDEKTGLQKPLLDENNIPLRWKPEFKATERYQSVVDAPGERVKSAKKQRQVNLTRRAGEVRRLIQARILSAESMPFNERADFLASDEGLARIDTLTNRLISSGKISESEGKEAKKAFGVK